MWLMRLKTSDVRNIAQTDLNFCPHLNIISGPNASGKTSLLEAMHLLSTGRSFRTVRLQPVIRHGSATALAFGLIESGRPPHVNRIGVQRDRRETRFRIDGEEGNAAQLASRFPLQLIDPDAHRLLDNGPRYRRHFLDWGLFHVEPRFLGLWRRYVRALKQRNVLLRARSSEAASGWEQELIRAGEQIAEMRQAYIRQLEVRITQFAEELLAVEGISVWYDRGWRGDESLRVALERQRKRDLQLGYTTVGAHRSDFVISRRGQNVQEALSRGQQKVLICALRMAQAEHFQEKRGEPCIFMLDDLPAELDGLHRARLLKALARMSAQVFVTTTEPGAVETAEWPSVRMFHVERGEFQEVIY